MSETAKWYVIHTYSGYENKVAETIMTVAANRNHTDLILGVYIPTEKVEEITETGRVKEYDRKLLPGYVLVKMILNDDSWYDVRNVRGVTGFVGPGSKPVPLTEGEMKPLGVQGESLVIDFAEGDNIIVTDGVWKDTLGVIQSINTGKQCVTINVELFGREPPVEISFSEIRKM